MIQPQGLGAIDRLDEITGIGRHAAQTIIAEVGLNMAVFPTAAHLASWANLSPRAIQSGTKNRSGKTGKANRYLRSALGEAAASAGRTYTFLGARYRRLARRIGKLKALVAVSIDPGHRLEPALRPHHPLPRPRPRLRRPDPPRATQEPPHPPTRSTRLHRHTQLSCLETPKGWGPCSDQARATVRGQSS